MSDLGEQEEIIEVEPVREPVKEPEKEPVPV